jgi:hypothetical protein
MPSPPLNVESVLLLPSAMVWSSQDIITVPSKGAGCNCLAVLLIVGFLAAGTVSCPKNLPRLLRAKLAAATGTDSWRGGWR